MDLESSCTQSLELPLVNAKISLMIKTSYSASLLEKRNSSLKDRVMSVPLGPYSTIHVPPPQ